MESACWNSVGNVSHTFFPLNLSASVQNKLFLPLVTVAYQNTLNCMMLLSLKICLIKVNRPLVHPFISLLSVIFISTSLQMSQSLPPVHSSIPFILHRYGLLFLYSPLSILEHALCRCLFCSYYISKVFQLSSLMIICSLSSPY